jgi:hypothetical protein
MDAQLQAAVSDRSTLDDASTEDHQDGSKHLQEDSAFEELTTKPTPN